MSPVDSYYQVLDYINKQTCYNCGAGASKIMNTHPLAKHLQVLLRLANQAEHQEEEE